MTARIARVDHGITSGTFSLDGETFDVDNNIWVVGDDTECLVIDAPHSVAGILEVVGDRKVTAIVCTHAHDDHIRMAPALREKVMAPILLHPDDRSLWELTHGGPDDPHGELWDADLADGQVLTVAGTTLQVLHTPGHAPGAVCLYSPDLGCVFTGDTLFHGGPGATGRSFSDRPTLEASIRAKLFALPDDTVVHTGHGDVTTIAAERAQMAAEAVRGARQPSSEGERA
ncbi:MBL fold metallo-hydrolase [Nocardia sp. NPDC052112]|uniref:MBL fold metallo-hydrolase n=1 Tax=Nocardia sp. NPDC052112 TaxID=3155646 RepID=UPI003444CBF5